MAKTSFLEQDWSQDSEDFQNQQNFKARLAE
jgi:hypothetical protein